MSPRYRVACAFAMSCANASPIFTSAHLAHGAFPFCKQKADTKGLLGFLVSSPIYIKREVIKPPCRKVFVFNSLQGIALGLGKVPVHAQKWVSSVPAGKVPISGEEWAS